MKLAREALAIIWMAFLATVAAPAGASDTYGFKVYQLGSDFKALEAYRPNPGCNTPRDAVAGDRICIFPDGAESIGGANIKRVALFYYGDKLNFIRLKLDVHDINAVIEALTDRYGPPKKRTSNVQTRAGVVLVNEHHSWDNGESSITADRYAESVEESDIVFTLKSGLVEFNRRAKESRKQRQKDL